MNEEEKEKFAFFFSSFDAAFIAAGTEVEIVVARDMERAVYGKRNVATDDVTTDEGLWTTRTLEQFRCKGVGREG